METTIRLLGSGLREVWGVGLGGWGFGGLGFAVEGSWLLV